MVDIDLQTEAWHSMLVKNNDVYIYRTLLLTESQHLFDVIILPKCECTQRLLVRNLMFSDVSCRVSLLYASYMKLYRTHLGFLKVSSCPYRLAITHSINVDLLHKLNE